MCRRKSRFFHSILFRISVCILTLGLLGMLSVNWFVRIRMQNHIEEQIAEELLRVWDNFLLYVQQTLLLHGSDMNTADFELYSAEIAEQLAAADYRDVLLCTPYGEPLAGAEELYEMWSGQEDFALAGEQKGAFTVRYGEDGGCKVSFSAPVVLKGRFYGWISSMFDYGELYAGQMDTVERITWITVAVFGMICLTIWVTVWRIVSPIRDLSSAVSEASAGLADNGQGSLSLERLTVRRRRDEVGELTRNYLEMLQTIERQIGKIQEDKEWILKLWGSRQEFYNNVTHELKTPLTTISGYAQLLVKNGPGDEELFRAASGHILEESERLYRMVVQLLELQTKAEAEEPKRLNLAAILKDVAEAMKIKAQRYGNTLITEGTEEDFLVDGREDRIRQVLINLTDNAIKYGEPDGPIRLRIEEKEGRVQITVSNRGPGIRQEDLKSVFEPFFRADRSLPGEIGSSGLGLSIAAGIMEEHGGSITADSVPGEETVFTVSFPGAGK
ncbi:MAG: HAMP domain-containing histidine kinase [bacterium]|nr:HAMP domain-containing histidine kinase [bacterium]